MSEVLKRKVIQHMLYSGLGGHGSVFFSLVEGDVNKEFDYRGVFCGVVDMREEYRDKCNQLEIPYQYLKKKHGLHLASMYHLFKFFYKNKPSVIFLHGVTFGIISALCYKIINPGTRILVRDTQAHHLKTKAEWFWMFFCVALAKRIVVLTEASGEGIKKKFGWLVGKRKLVTIPNGLNMAKYQPVCFAPTEKKIAIGMQSRLQPIKDHSTLIKAFKIVKDKLPDYTLSLHIAGDGETMPDVKKLIEELGLSQHVVLYGMLNEKELLDFMQSLQIYVHATFGETLSNSIMQAMACGLPVIASDVWGVNNMINHDKNGWLYTSKDHEQLADKIELLITKPKSRKALGDKARNFAEQNYSNDVMFNSYKKLYN